MGSLTRLSPEAREKKVQMFVMKFWIELSRVYFEFWALPFNSTITALHCLPAMLLPSHFIDRPISVAPLNFFLLVFCPQQISMHFLVVWPIRVQVHANLCALMNWESIKERNHMPKKSSLTKPKGNPRNRHNFKWKKRIKLSGSN